MRKLSVLVIAAYMVACAALLCGVFSLASASAAQSPYARNPARGDRVRFDGSHSGERAAWGFEDQRWLEWFLRLSVDAALNGDNDDPHSPVRLVKERALVVDNGTTGVVQDTRAFRYRDHDDLQVQVQVSEGRLRNHTLWTTAAELVDAHGVKYLK